MGGGGVGSGQMMVGGNGWKLIINKYLFIIYDNYAWMLVFFHFSVDFITMCFDILSYIP